MEHRLSRKQAVTIVAAIIAILLILSIFPFRMWQREHALGTDAQRSGASGMVSAGTAAGEYFLAQGTHLDSISFYIDNVESGSKADVLLYSIDPGNGAVTLLAKERVTLPQGSGWITAEMDTDMVPGNQYIAFATSGTKDLTTGLDDNRQQAVYSVGLQTPTEENLAYLQYSFLHQIDAESDLASYRGGEQYDTGMDGYFLMMSFVYREPLNMRTSAALIALIAVLFLVFLYAAYRFLNGAPGRNKEVTVRRVLQWTVTPIVLLFTASFLVLIAKGSFDYRKTENILYAAGFLLFSLIALYGLFHKTDPADADADGLLTSIADGLACVAAGKGRYTAEERFAHAEELIQTALVALLLVYGCDYMNGLYEVFHTIAERRMAIVLLLIILCTFRAREIFHPVNLALAGAGAGIGVWWFLHHLKGPDQFGHAYDDQGLVLGIIVVVLFAVTISAMVLSFLGRRKRGVQDTVRTDRLTAAMLAVFGLWIVLFRNTRGWPIALTVLYGLFYLRFRFYERRDRFLTILSNGIVLHFVLVVLWCLLRRYYLSFLYIRFSMQFHTVTVTAEYLTMVEAVVMTRLVLRFMQASGRSLRGKLSYVWKEAVLFGTATVYLLFTMSRTGVAAVIVMAVAVFAAVLVHELRVRHRGALLRVLAGAAACVLSVVLLFPTVFTLQRVLPAVNGDPYVFDSVESYPDEITRGRHWNSMYYICFERFERVFASKMFGMQEMEYDYWKEYLEAHPEIDPKDTCFRLNYGGRDENGKYIWLSYEDLMGETPEETEARWEAQQAAAGMTGDSEETAAQDVSEAAGSADDAAVTDTADAAVTEDAAAADSSGGSSAQNIYTADAGSYSTGDGESSDYSNGRTTIWKCYIPNLNLTGHNEMGVPLPNGETAVHAHNTFLQAAYDFGIIGAILFVLVLLLTFIRACGYYGRDARETDADRLIPFAVIAGFTAAGMVEWLFQFSNPATVVLFLAIAPLTVLHSTERRKK